MPGSRPHAHGYNGTSTYSVDLKSAMPEFILTPEQKTHPTAPDLLDQIHKVGFPVEINVKGKPDSWDALRFYEPGPPEVECLVSFDGDTGKYNLHVSADAPAKAFELQLALVELFLKNLGGQVDNRHTRERFTASEFALKMRLHRVSQDNPWDWFWLVFSWLVVIFGLFLFFGLHPTMKPYVLSIMALSLVSAVGLTYTRFKNK